MELHIEDIEFNQQRIVGAAVYFSLNERYFPGENWYDAVSTDLEAWLPQLLSFARNHTDLCLFSFQDGPCCVKLKRLPNGDVTVSCLWDQKTEIPDTVIDFPHFLGSTVKALRQYHRVLHEQGVPFSMADHLSQLTQVKKQFENVT